ncbi:GNAT family N-acetyltransferase [Paenibacillus segetis]|uniref:GNAT family N-acetyltransferase n=1 Tax=Paenibacillus segetis TaxID=1325360 RepID=UPI001E59DF33|nr:GNAT family N-acetyltransferase [Paenibacillus segetis]
MTSKVDASPVKELLESAVFSDPEALEQAIKLYSSNGEYELYAYVDEDEYVGLIGGRMNSDHQLEIIHLAVRPEDRMKGYGRGLIVEMILQKQPTSVFTVTDEEGAEFFRNVGFQVMGFESNEGGLEQFRCFYEVDDEEEAEE